MQLSPEYLAGLFDGEGNVEITNKLALRIGVSNTFRPVIEAIRTQYGGSIGVINPGRDKKGHWKIGYLWRAGGETARRFLEDVTPSLVIKRLQAEAGLQITSDPHRRKLSSEERKRREAIRATLRALNKRGTSWAEGAPS